MLCTDLPVGGELTSACACRLHRGIHAWKYLMYALNCTSMSCFSEKHYDLCVVSFTTFVPLQTYCDG